MGVQVDAHAAGTGGTGLRLAGRKPFWRGPGMPRDVIPGLRPRLLAVGDAIDRYRDASAAVAVILRERDGLAVLLQERAARAEDPWSGQWAFPGGRRQRDEPLLDAVLRETREEIGVSLREADVLGCMEARSPGNRPELLVLPFVFRADGTEDPKAGPEVASTAWISLDRLASVRTSVTIHIRGRVLRDMPAFVDGPRTIWGFTYRALQDLLRLLPQ